MTTARRNPNGQTPFGSWVQSHPDLEAITHSLTVTDADMMFHKYKTYVDAIGTRQIQLQMWVEVKTYGANLTKSQHETLFDHHQGLCTRKQTVMRRSPFGGMRQVWHFGVCILRLQEDVPTDGGIEWGVFNPDGSIEWYPNGTCEALVDLLRFNSRPDDPRQPLSIRRHHKNSFYIQNVKTELGFSVDERLVVRS